MLPPLSYYGGKILLVPQLLSLIPEHKTYCEVFGGGAALLFAKAPVRNEVYNDLEGEVVNLFRVLRDRATADQLIESLRLTPYAYDEYQQVRYAAPVDDPVEKARRYFILTQQSFVHQYKGSWAGSRTKGFALTFRNAVEHLNDCVGRLRAVILENRHFREVIPKYDSERALFYCDPPYEWGSRVRTGNYKCEMTDAEHDELLNLLKNVKGRVILSGYHSPRYDTALKDWTCREYERSCRATVISRGKIVTKSRRIECVWTNF